MPFGNPVIHSSVCSEDATGTLAVPKIFRGIRLEYFDRGAKPCSLHRPQDALCKLCSKGRLFGTVKTVPYIVTADLLCEIRCAQNL